MQPSASVRHFALRGRHLLPHLALLLALAACLPVSAAPPKSDLIEIFDGPNRIVTNIHRKGLLRPPEAVVLRRQSLAATGETLQGDLNADSALDLVDIAILENHLLERATLTPGQRQLADMNADSRVDLADLGALMRDLDTTSTLMIIDDVEGLSVVSTTDDQVELKWTQPGPSPLRAGFVIISQTEPNIFLRRILALENQDEYLTAQTRPASLMEAFGDAVRQQGENAFFRAELTLWGLTPPESSGDPTNQPLHVMSVLNEIGPQGETVFGERIAWDLGRSLYGSSEEPLHVYIPSGGGVNENQIWLEVDIPIEWELGPWGPKYVDVSANADVGIDFTLMTDLLLSHEWGTGRFLIPGMKLERTLPPVGGVVLTIEVNMDAEIEVRGQVQSTGSSGLHAESQFDFHARYENNELNVDPITVTPTIYAKPVQFQLEGTLDATITLYPTLEIEIYRMVGPNLALSPHVTLEGHGALIPPTADYHIYDGADLIFGLNFGIWENIFNAKDIYAPPITLWDQHTLFQGSLLNIITLDVTPDSAAWTLSGPSGYSLGGSGDRMGASPIVVSQAGDYTLTCSGNVAGWDPPASQTRTLAQGGSLAFSAAYSQTSTAGSITIDTTPSGGKWRLNGPASFTGIGDRSFSNAPAGEYTLVCYDNLTGYTPPASQTKTLAAGGSIVFAPQWTPEGGAEDDHGNDAAHATSVQVNELIAGKIETGGDIDWLKFQASSGTRYVISTSLGSLDDSFLYLYGTNATSQLAANDDYGDLLSSRLEWTCPSSGYYFVAARAYNTSQTGTYKVYIAPVSAQPTLTINLPGNVPLELVRIPAGTFQMGSPDSERSRDSDEGPVHTVTIGYDFYMGRTEVTQAQWLAVMGSWPGSAPSSRVGAGDNYPAYYVSWNDCQNFIAALNTHLANTSQGVTVRLPSEAEWEYACRAGTTTRFYFGDSLSVDDYDTDGPTGSTEYPGNRGDYMWFGGNNGSSGTSAYGSKPVGTKQPNAWGLYDMSGNVWEWCQDWWHSSYSGAPTDGGAWEYPVDYDRVWRGGGWDFNAGYCRLAYRIYGQACDRCVGFRLATGHP